MGSIPFIEFVALIFVERVKHLCIFGVWLCLPAVPTKSAPFVGGPGQAKPWCQTFGLARDVILDETALQSCFFS